MQVPVRRVHEAIQVIIVFVTVVVVRHRTLRAAAKRCARVVGESKVVQISASSKRRARARTLRLPQAHEKSFMRNDGNALELLLRECEGGLVACVPTLGGPQTRSACTPLCVCTQTHSCDDDDSRANPVRCQVARAATHSRCVCLREYEPEQWKLASVASPGRKFGAFSAKRAQSAVLSADFATTQRNATLAVC